MKTPRTFFRAFLLLTLLIVAGGFTNRAHAQYQSFFGDSITEYSIGTYATVYDPEFFGRMSHPLTYYSDDTVVFDGKTYFRPHCEPYLELTPDYYLREDTLMGRIYRYCTRTNTEYLICDMSLEVGDTFAFPFYPDYYIENDQYNDYYGEDFYIPIGGVVDTILYLNGKKNIIFRTDTASNNPCNTPLYLFFDNAADDIIPIQFIEGIGPNYSPCGSIDNHFLSCRGGFFYRYMGAWTCAFSYPLLLCAHKDGELTYMADERAGCDQMIPLFVKGSDLCNWTVYPNPVHNTLNIRFETELVRHGIIYITDMVGRVVYSQETAEQHLKINVKRLQSGIYIATWFADGKKQSVKFIKK